MSANADNRRPPGLWLWQAVGDYAAARCCLLHGLFSGFVLGQQAVEKLLKAHLLLGNMPTKSKRRAIPNVHPQHDLLSLAQDVDAISPALRIVAEHGDLLTRLSHRFEAKYPDSKAGFINASTAELHELDELAIALFLSTDQPADEKARNGIYPVFWHLVDPLQAQRPESVSIRQGNLTLQRRWPEIRSVIEPLFGAGAG